MKLEVTDPRQAFILRCQAWAYANVLNGKYHHAEKLFAERLAAFDHMAENNSADNAGYWAAHYYKSFVAACKLKYLDQL